MKRKSNTMIPWKRRGAWNGKRVVEIWLDERWSPSRPVITITPSYDRYHYSEMVPRKSEMISITLLWDAE
jgi:hypothetical protein